MGLARTDWVDAALEALAREGLSGVAIDPLARRLRATKGSFYWHFAERDELIAATLELWEKRDTDDVIAMVEHMSDPVERLATLTRFAFGEAARGDADAGLLAAASDPRVQPVLKRVTQKRIAFVERLYRDLGLAAEEAVRHARITYALYLGIGQLRRAWPRALPGSKADAHVDLAVRALLGAAGVPLDDVDAQPTAGHQGRREGESDDRG
jgi:AcrR family transcriptional regulator